MTFAMAGQYLYVGFTQLIPNGVTLLSVSIPVGNGEPMKLSRIGLGATDTGPGWFELNNAATLSISQGLDIFFPADIIFGVVGATVDNTLMVGHDTLLYTDINGGPVVRGGADILLSWNSAKGNHEINHFLVFERF